jgi:uncharacterized protein (TIGR01777 family)
MRVAIAGGTGLIGVALAAALRARGDEVLVLTRRTPKSPDAVQWDPRKGIAEKARVDGLDAIVNVAGAPIADRPWTKARRKELWESRVDATAVLGAALAALPSPPRVWVGAGGLGRFGDCGAEVVDDDHPPGTGFLAELSVAWEGAHERAAGSFGARWVVLRKGIVLAANGGAFPLMLTPFRFGLGGWLGDGQQYTAWISLRDTVRAYVFALSEPAVSGGVNATVPDPAQNKEWSRALGRALHRPVLTHAPKWALRGALGELADDLFLASTRAVPRRLLAAGFTFEDVDAESTFRGLLAL